MLNTPAEDWGLRGAADRRNETLFYRGRDYSFDELAATRRAAQFGDLLTAEHWSAEQERNKAAIAVLADTYAAVRPDVAIVVSSDHMEVFDRSGLPGILIYTGESVPHVPPTAEQIAAMPPSLGVAATGYVPERAETVPCDSRLASFLVEQAISAGFEPSTSSRLPAGRYENHSIPHGWGFVYRRIMRGEVTRNVPIFVNTFFPPNQPSPNRCWAFGTLLARAAQAFDDDVRIAVIASGGLSHFVVDEELDRQFLAELEAADEGYLPESNPSFRGDQLMAGTSELRSWLVAAGAATAADLAMNVVDYVPCYRTEAGTGTGMGFVVWSDHR